MANEARIQASLQISLSPNQYQSRPTSFNADVSVFEGPTPGYMVASQSGTIVDLSKLTTPGLAWVGNLDATDLIILELGVYDPDTNEFYPMLELLSGEFYPLRLSQFLGQEMGTSSPGTGSTGSGVQLMVRGVGGTCPCRIDAFNK